VGPGGQPGEIAPQASRERQARAVTRQPPSRSPQPGDLICGECGESNPPNRKFCSRCGTSLQTAVTVATPWWRKIFPKRKARSLEAGSRPGQGGVRAQSRRRATLAKVFPTIRKVIAAGLLLGGIVYGIFQPFRNLINAKYLAVQNKVVSIIHPQFDPVHSNRDESNVATRGHPAHSAVDNFTNTFWAAPVGRREPTLILHFDSAVNLDKAIVHNGIIADFQSSDRARNLHLVYNNGQTFDVELKDTPEKQTIALGNGRGITSVEIHVTSVYKSVKSNDVAITEIELFSKR